MNKPIINGIDVSEYFIDVVDEGGSTIDYKILPNSERLLVEKIFEQNQQLKNLQEENKKLKNKNNDLIEEIARGNIDTAILQKENEGLKKRQMTKNGFICDCEQNAKYKQALEEIRDIAQIHQYFNPELLEIKGDIGRIQDLKMTEIFKKCNEVLNDRG